MCIRDRALKAKATASPPKISGVAFCKVRSKESASPKPPTTSAEYAVTGDAFWERMSTAPINKPNTTAVSGIAMVRSSERLITRLGGTTHREWCPHSSRSCYPGMGFIDPSANPAITSSRVARISSVTMPSKSWNGASPTSPKKFPPSIVPA